MLATLTTGHKLGLGLVGLAFVVFAISSSFLLPRLRPDFPGTRGLRWFLVVAFTFFVAMLAAVEVFGSEPSEAKAGGRHATALKVRGVQVTERDFKIRLASRSLHPGPVTFAVSNKGPSPHNLAIVGPGVKAQSATIAVGTTTTLRVTLRAGTYDVFCAIPGHKQAGMDVKLSVS